jgi:hypothetical protein
MNMRSEAHMPLGRVWAVAVPIFLVSAWSSRALTHRTSPMPSYWVGLVGLLAIGAALIISWRGLGNPGGYTPRTAAVLRGVVGIGIVLWFLAMLFPFL